MLQAELEMLNEEPSGAFRRASDLQNKAAERVGGHEQCPKTPEEEEEEALDEKVQHNRSSDSHDGQASDGTSGSVSCEGPGDQDGADRAPDQDQGAERFNSPAKVLLMEPDQREESQKGQQTILDGSRPV